MTKPTYCLTACKHPIALLTHGIFALQLTAKWYSCKPSAGLGRQVSQYMPWSDECPAEHTCYATKAMMACSQPLCSDTTWGP